VWHFEMQVHNTNVEMFRDTNDCRNITEKIGVIPEKNGRSDQPFTKKTKTEKGEDNRRLQEKLVFGKISIWRHSKRMGSEVQYWCMHILCSLLVRRTRKRMHCFWKLRGHTVTKWYIYISYKSISRKFEKSYIRPNQSCKDGQNNRPPQFFLEQIFVSLKILQNRDFLFSIHSHVDVYLKLDLCRLIYEEGIQSVTLTKASF